MDFELVIDSWVTTHCSNDFELVIDGWVTKQLHV